MSARHIMIICGVPGAGKSTLAAHVVERWGAVAHESDDFVNGLIEGGRTSAGDFTDEALEQAYQSMGNAVVESLKTHWLVLAVGAFRTVDQRKMFRQIADQAGVGTTAILVDTPAEVAAERVKARSQRGRLGPTSTVIDDISAQLDAAMDIDFAITNGTTTKRFQERIDSVMTSLAWVLEHPTRAVSEFVERFEELVGGELRLARAAIEPTRLRTWPVDRVSAVVRSALPESVPVSVVPMSPQHCRIDVSSAHADAVSAALRNAGLRVAFNNEGLFAYLPALSPSTRAEIAQAIERELQLARDRVRQLRNYSLFGLVERGDGPVGAALQRATDKWVNAVDQLGRAALADIPD